MECRICHQPISFVRGHYPGHKRQATRAVHNNELPRVLSESNGEVVQPHPGAGRRLRQELEAQHSRNQPAAAAQPAEQETPAYADIRQENLAVAGGQRLAAELEQYTAVSPELTAGDIDAAWQRAEASGEETPGGHAATPDQDSVDEIGRAVGMELQDNQELHTHEELLAKRDRHRWELNRSSADGDSI
jgi:hypothetical protein